MISLISILNNHKMSFIKNLIHDHEISNNDQFKKHLTKINKLSSNDKNLNILVNLLLINYLKLK